MGRPARTHSARAGGLQHHRELPRAELDAAVATVLVGEFAGTASPARHDTPLVGADVELRAGATTLPLRPDFEYALLVLVGGVTVVERRLAPGHLGYLGRGRAELALHAADPARVLVLGGEPWDEPILMWWNFVARDRGEIEAAYRDWRDETGRFGRVASPLSRIPALPPYWTVQG